MIVKGNERGGGQNLAAHLLNEFTNDRVEVIELAGAVAPDLHGAFAEWYGHSKVTKGKKYLFSLSVSPDERQRRLTPAEFKEFADRVGRKLKLDGQPRAIVIHEKNDKLGVPREHVHIVWSRTNTEEQKFVHLSEYKLKLRAVTREFANDHGLVLPHGMRKDGLKDRFDRQAEVSEWPETQQEERSGIPKEERMKAIAEAWMTTDTGEAFIRALADKNYYLAQGDRRGYVVVDMAGEVHSLARQIKGVKSPEIKSRLAAFPPQSLPVVEKAQEHARQVRQHRENTTEPELRAPAGPTPDEQRAALKEDHRQQRALLEKEADAIKLEHAREAGRLTIDQALADAAIARKRNSVFQVKGFTSFLLSLPVMKSVLGRVHARQDRERGRLQKTERQILEKRHGSEIGDINRKLAALRRVQKRETRSLETLLGREAFQRIAGTDAEQTKGKSTTKLPEKLTPELTPEQSLKEAFEPAANPVIRQPAKPLPKPGSLKEFFNRQAVNTEQKQILPETAEQRPDPIPTLPEPEPVAMDESLRATFAAAADARGKVEPEPEQTPKPGSLADQFRRVANQRERSLDGPDSGLEKNFRRLPADRTVRR